MKSQSEANGSQSRRLRGRAARSQSIGTKLTLDEEAEALAAAESLGKAPSEWAREVILWRPGAQGRRKKIAHCLPKSRRFACS